MSAQAFAALQERLGTALEANCVGSPIDHVLVVLPSYSVSESLLSHYGERIPSLEHRYAGAMLIPGRIASCQIVYVSSRSPRPEIVDYYLSLLPPRITAPASVGGSGSSRSIDGTSRSVAAKLVDRPDLVSDIRDLIGDRPAFIEPWNVTEQEVALAIALGVPINGTSPGAPTLGFKSAGRRLFAEAGVPMPFGREDVRTTDDLIEAIVAIRFERPDVDAVVVKHDDSGAGDGNIVLDLTRLASAEEPIDWLRSTVAALPDWYRLDLEKGGIVEERIVGVRFTSPSAQADILPSGEVVVLATHEQVLGGPGGQVYLGCRFPADPAYAPLLARHAIAVGRLLAARGVRGRFSVDFVAADDGAGDWRVFALEVNLRKGGTTHPYSALRNLVPGRYDPDEGRWVAREDRSMRTYSATDNLVDPAWLGLAPAAVIDVVRAAGLQFDTATGTGVVLHMLSGLAIDGRFGLTAIGRTPGRGRRPVRADPSGRRPHRVSRHLRGHEVLRPGSAHEASGRSRQPLASDRADRSTEAQLLVPPAIVVAEHAAEVVDFAGVVGVVRDHGREDPSGRAQLAPVGHPWSVEFGITVEGAEMRRQATVGFREPGDDFGRLGRILAPRLDLRRRETQCARPEGVVVVHDLAGADLDRDRLDRARSTRR